MLKEQIEKRDRGQRAPRRTKKEQIIALYMSGVTDLEELAEMTQARPSAATNDRAGQHHALSMALVMFDRARWTGKARKPTSSGAGLSTIWYRMKS